MTFHVFGGTVSPLSVCEASANVQTIFKGTGSHETGDEVNGSPREVYKVFESLKSVYKENLQTSVMVSEKSKVSSKPR